MTVDKRGPTPTPAGGPRTSNQILGRGRASVAEVSGGGERTPQRGVPTEEERRLKLLGAVAAIAREFGEERILREAERALSSRNGSRGARGRQSAENPFAALPSPLNDRRSKNMRASIRHLAANPGASNREIAKALGKHEGQICEMLDRLLHKGLLDKHVGGRGKTNAWTLSPAGEAAAQALKQLSTGPS